MKPILLLALAAATVSIGACSKSPSDKLADRVENAADARADAMENEATSLNQRAAEIRKTGEQRSDAIDAANRNVSAMTPEQRNAIVANEAAAVR
ncbi:MAG: hypothetical protein ABI898_01765 [Sphingomonadales bacterium]